MEKESVKPLYLPLLKFDLLHSTPTIKNKVESRGERPIGKGQGYLRARSKKRTKLEIKPIVSSIDEILNSFGHERRLINVVTKVERRKVIAI